MNASIWTWIVQGLAKIAIATLTCWQTSHSGVATGIVALTGLSGYLSQRPPCTPTAPAVPDGALSPAAAPTQPDGDTALTKLAAAAVVL